jgi:hypothetical protein
MGTSKALRAGCGPMTSKVKERQIAQFKANLERLQRMEKSLVEFTNAQVNLEEKDYDMLHVVIGDLAEMIKVEKIKKAFAERDDT